MNTRSPALTVALVVAVCALATASARDASGDGSVYTQLGALHRAERLDLGSREAATLLLNGGFPAAWVDEAGGDRQPEYLRWPIPGYPLGRGFGSRDGTHLAVDITAPEGTPVQVMAPGIVGYADDGVSGYGNLVLVVHPGGWVTLYAHLSEFEVIPGQRVERSEVIGLVGNTGVSRGPHLHFALIKRGIPVDPLEHMRDAPGQPRDVS